MSARDNRDGGLLTSTKPKRSSVVPEISSDEVIAIVVGAPVATVTTDDLVISAPPRPKHPGVQPQFRREELPELRRAPAPRRNSSVTASTTSNKDARIAITGIGTPDATPQPLRRAPSFVPLKRPIREVSHRAEASEDFEVIDEVDASPNSSKR